MSDKKDERDIDEILASIDAMLAEKDDDADSPSKRRETVEKAAQSSEDVLGLSSSAEETQTSSKLQPFESLDDTSDKEPDDASDESSDEEANKTNDTEETDDENAPRQRIVLTEEYLEPSAQESLPLWAAQASTAQDEPNNEATESAENVVNTEGTEPAEPQDEALNNKTTDDQNNTAEESESISETDNMDDVLGNLDDFDIPDFNVPDETISEENQAFEDNAADQTFFFEETPTPENSAKDLEAGETEAAIEEELEDIAEATDADEKEENVEIQADETNRDDEISVDDHHEEQAVEDESSDDNDNTNDEFDAVFDAIANDDTITFDISEAMSEDTVYDIEVLDKELVEAFVQDVVHEHDTDNIDEIAETKADDESDFNDMDIETSTNEEVNEDTNDEADDSSEQTLEDDVVDIDEDKAIDDAEDEAEPLAAHIQTSVQEAVEQDDTITLNPDELDPIIEAISDDVRIKINQHLQQILPELISDALLEHLAATRDDTE